MQSMGKALYSKDHKHLVAKLRKSRQEAGLDQEDVARILGKTRSYVSKIESGQRRVDVVQLKEFAKIYKKPIEFFLGRTEFV